MCTQSNREAKCCNGRNRENRHGPGVVVEVLTADGEFGLGCKGQDLGRPGGSLGGVTAQLVGGNQQGL